MKVLHILRSEPDQMTRELIEKSHTESQKIMFPLYNEERIDYAKLVQKVFESDKVISWW